MKEQSKSVKFFQSVGFYGSLACLPATIFVGPIMAFPAALCFLGVTATSVAIDIEQKRTLPKKEQETSSVAQIVKEFQRLNGQSMSSVGVEFLDEPSPIEEVIEIQNEIDELSSFNVLKKKRKEHELEEKKEEVMDDWEKQMALLLADVENGGEEE